MMHVYVVLCILPFEMSVSPFFDYFIYIKYSVNKEIRIFKGLLPQFSRGRGSWGDPDSQPAGVNR